MSYFDGKEEVINVVLTPYGRSLLSQGKLKPVYYSFHDEDILYDNQYSGEIDENNSASYGRIVDNTPYLKPQSRYITVDESKKNAQRLEQFNQKSLIANLIGNSSLTSDYRPAWSVAVLSGTAETCEMKYNDLDIPQINLSPIKLNVSAVPVDAVKKSGDVIYKDGSAIRVGTDRLIVDISEANVDVNDYMFEMEVFEVLSKEDGSEELIQIPFTKRINNIVDGILLDDGKAIAEEITPGTKLVENYFNILVDNEIELSVRSSAIPQSVKKIVKPPFGESC